MCLTYNRTMAMGTRKMRERQKDLWYGGELPTAPGHPFYKRLNEVLDNAKFDPFCETNCASFYHNKLGRPSLPPGQYSASSTVTLAQFAPAFSLLDAHHVAGIITRTDGSGAYGSGTYDILGPTGSSLGYATVAAKSGDAVTLFAVGLGPTNPHVPSGQPFSGSAPTTNPVTVRINNVA